MSPQNILKTALSVWTLVPCSWDIADASVLAHMPSKEDWGSHILQFQCEREERYPGAWAVYRLSWNPMTPVGYSRNAVAEILKHTTDSTVVRLWAPSAGPSGRHRAPYSEFPFVEAIEIVRAGAGDLCLSDADGQFRASFRWLLSLAAAFLEPLASPGEGARLVRELIQRGEGSAVEFKSSFQWDVAQAQRSTGLRSSVLKTIAAFLNTSGGTLLIGVEDDGTICGLNHDLGIVHHSADEFAQLLTSLMTDTMGGRVAAFVSIRFETVESQTVCVVDVEPAADPVFVRESSAKAFYVRFGNTTRALDTEEATKYIAAHWL